MLYVSKPVVFIMFMFLFRIVMSDCMSVDVSVFHVNGSKSSAFSKEKLFSVK